MLHSLSMFHCEVKIQATVTSPYLCLCDGQDASMSMHRTLVLFSKIEKGVLTQR